MCTCTSYWLLVHNLMQLKTVELYIYQKFCFLLLFQSVLVVNNTLWHLQHNEFKTDFAFALEVKMKETKKRFLKSPKTQLKKIKVTGQWKPITIDASRFGEEDLDGLVCCEELTDYKLINARKSSEKKAKRRASDNSEELKSAPKKQKISGDDLPTAATKTKIKRKKKKINNQPAEVEEKSVNLSDDVNKFEYSDKNETGGTETNIAVNPKRKKMKKRAGAPRSSRLDEKVKNWTKHSCPSEQATDVSAWKDLFVPEPVLQALSSLGYSAPTPIQALVLPPAIRDKLDILGAAETGWYYNCIKCHI